MGSKGMVESENNDIDNIVTLTWVGLFRVVLFVSFPQIMMRVSQFDVAKRQCS